MSSRHSFADDGDYVVIVTVIVVVAFCQLSFCNEKRKVKQTWMVTSFSIAVYSLFQSHQSQRITHTRETKSRQKQTDLQPIIFCFFFYPFSVLCVQAIFGMTFFLLICTIPCSAHSLMLSCCVNVAIFADNLKLSIYMVKHFAFAVNEIPKKSMENRNQAHTNDTHCSS